MSPWRTQVIVTTNKRHKREWWLTILRFTTLNAYPLPKIKELVNKVAQYKICSIVYLKSAYHQVPISEKDKIYTTYEADGMLYQFCRVSFGVTNRVTCFQRIIDKVITDNALSHTFADLDNYLW